MLPIEVPRLIKEYTRSRPYSPLLYSLIHDLRSKGYTLNDIAAPVGVSKTTILNWERVVREPDAHPLTDSLPARPTSPHTPQTPTLTEDEVKTLRSLHFLATQRTRWSEPGDPEHDAHEKLTQILKKHSDRGVTVAHMARQMDTSRRTVTRRING